jgi:tRNA G18 (ribose-2'-O)-methylase SpoU
MGAHFHYPAFHTSWEEVQGFLSRTAVTLWAADADGDHQLGGAPERLALAVGNEGGGLSETTRAAASRLVAVPIATAVESLNVAVATGILLHELRR